MNPEELEAEIDILAATVDEQAGTIYALRCQLGDLQAQGEHQRRFLAWHMIALVILSLVCIFAGMRVGKHSGRLEALEATIETPTENDR